MNKYLNGDYLWGLLTAASGWAASFMAPTLPFVSIIFILVLADLFTGTRAARSRGEDLHSKGYRRTVEKFVLYFVAMLLSEGMRRVFVPIVPVTYIVAFAIALTEFRSNVENIETVTGVKIWNVVKERLKI